MMPAATLQPSRPWRTHPRETAAAAILGTAAMIALAQTGGATPLLQALDELSPQPSQPVTGLGVLRPHSRSHPGPHIARNAGWLPSSQPRWPAIIPAVPRPNRRRCVLFGCVEAPA